MKKHISIILPNYFYIALLEKLRGVKLDILTSVWTAGSYWSEEFYLMPDFSELTLFDKRRQNYNIFWYKSRKLYFFGISITAFHSITIFHSPPDYLVLDNAWGNGWLLIWFCPDSILKVSSVARTQQPWICQFRTRHSLLHLQVLSKTLMLMAWFVHAINFFNTLILFRISIHPCRNIAVLQKRNLLMSGIVAPSLFL